MSVLGLLPHETPPHEVSSPDRFGDAHLSQPRAKRRRLEDRYLVPDGDEDRPRSLR